MSSLAAFAPAPPRLSPEAARLRTYLGWAVIPTLLAGPMLLWLSFASGSAFVFATGCLTFANAPINALAYRLAGRNRVQAAVAWLAAGLWGIALALALAGTEVLGIVVLLAILPVVLAVPLLSPRALLVLSFVGCTLVLLSGAVGFAPAPPFPLDDLPQLPVRILQGLGTAALIAVCGVSIWHNRMTLYQVTLDLRAANEELRASERSLEHRVHGRTAELEESERELAAARDAAIEANGEKSRFLAQMSHELRTPLNAILGFSEVLRERMFGPLNEKQAEYVDDIHISGQHLLSLINDILDVARVEAGRLELVASRFDLPQTIENALLLVRERAARGQVELIAEIHPSLGEVEADERKIRQVLINLLTNAIKFTPPYGRVTIVGKCDGEAARIAISDTGVGINDADQKIIFEDFRQARATRAGEREGTGLGLPLSKRIVELHGGRIGVESDPGKGSTFFFSVPLHPSTANLRSPRDEGGA